MVSSESRDYIEWCLVSLVLNAFVLFVLIANNSGYVLQEGLSLIALVVLFIIPVLAGTTLVPVAIRVAKIKFSDGTLYTISFGYIIIYYLFLIFVLTSFGGVALVILGMLLIGNILIALYGIRLGIKFG